jgi:hypothetical protein
MIRCMKILLVFAFFFLAPLSRGDTEPGISDGNSLAEGLKAFNTLLDGGSLTRNQEYQAFCASSFVQGVFSGCAMWNILSPNTPFEFPKQGLQTRQVIKIVSKHLNDHPERLHENAEFLIFSALRDSFPNPNYKGTLPAH